MSKSEAELRASEAECERMGECALSRSEGRSSMLMLEAELGASGAECVCGAGRVKCCGCGVKVVVCGVPW